MALNHHASKGLLDAVFARDSRPATGQIRAIMALSHYVSKGLLVSVFAWDSRSAKVEICGCEESGGCQGQPGVRV